jgi:putative transposase
VTQRGNRRAQTFFCRGDYYFYLNLLLDYTRRRSVSVLAYCLMPNHVHLVLVPTAGDGLHRVMLPVSMRYAQRFNRERDVLGVLWQGRYFSSVLDGHYFRNAVRYVERNPVRAGLAQRAEEYPWSSAAAHCGLAHDGLLAMTPWGEQVLAEVKDWSAWLQSEDTPEALAVLRENTAKGLPCGSSDFVARLEETSGRVLRARPRGPRPGTGAPS